MGLIEMLINAPNFELGLKVGAKRALLSVIPPNDVRAYSFNKSVSFVQSNMSETYLSAFFDGVTENTRDYHSWPD